MKKLLFFLIIFTAAFSARAQYQAISAGESGMAVRSKLNSMFQQLYSSSVHMQFSADGLTSWHTGYEVSDNYFRVSYDQGLSWGAGIPIASEYMIVTALAADTLFIQGDTITGNLLVKRDTVSLLVTKHELAQAIESFGSYSAGTGLELVGNEFRNTAPDRPITLTGAGATTISGTYPNFTISSTDNNTIYTDEQAQDAVGAAIAAGAKTGISVTYDDASNKIDFVVASQTDNNYTTAEKTKLAGIAAGAEVNVNADWNAATGDAAILNKPSLSAVATSGSYTDLANKPSIPVVSDVAYNATSWDGNLDAPSKNAVRDKIESLIAGGGMVYPPAGIAVSTGSAWGTSVSDNSANWNTAFSDRMKWDGGATGLVAATGRSSLGATTVGSNFFTLTNPSAVTFPRINADNTISTLDAATFRTAIGAGTGSGSVTSVSMTVPTGLSVTGSPITSSGTFAVSLASGYSIPTTAEQTNWTNKVSFPGFGTTAGTAAQGNDSRINNGQTAYGWGNHAGLYKLISYVPSWNELTDKPTYFTPSSHGIGYHSDVIITNPTAGQTLQYDGSKFVNVTPSNQWTTDANGINYLSRVGIGANSFSNSMLYVLSTSGWGGYFVNSSSSGYGVYIKGGGPSTTALHVLDYNSNDLFSVRGSGAIYANSISNASTTNTLYYNTATKEISYGPAPAGGSGTVTSVGLSMPNIFTISGSPVTGAGTLTATLANQPANTIFAGPTGSTGLPTFRTLVDADIPDNITASNYMPLSGGTMTGGILLSTTILSTNRAITYNDTEKQVYIGNGTAAVPIDNQKTQTPTIASNMTLDWRSGSNMSITLTMNVILSIQNIPDGKSGTILVKQDATGGRTILISTWSGAGTGDLTEVTIGTNTAINSSANKYSTITYKRFADVVTLVFGKEN